MTNNICKWFEEVVTYLQNELKPEEKKAFEGHLPHCPTCSARLNDYQRVRARLSQMPAEKPRTNLADKIMEQITVGSSLKRLRLIWVAVAASILITVALGSLIIYHQQSQTTTVAYDETVTRALDWLVRNQATTGKWPVAKWGGNKQFEVALTGLSIMALAGSESDQTKKYMPHIRKGVDYLINQQAPDGRFGSRFNESLYNHGIATVCLLEIYALTEMDQIKEPIKSALNYLRRTQSPRGGWGYIVETGPPNTAVSFWSLQALLLAKSMGLGENVTPSIKKGFAWLASVSDEQGRPGYRAVADFPYGSETLSAMAAFCYAYGGAKYLPEKDKYQNLFDLLPGEVTTSEEINYYRSYFLAYVEHPSLTEWHKNLVKHLAQHQAQSNDLNGSWEPSDQWSQVGGRIYSTALAALTLEVATRGSWLKSYLNP